MVTKATDGNDLHIGADATEPLAEDRHIDLYMVLHRIGLQSPDMGEDSGFGQVALSGL